MNYNEVYELIKSLNKENIERTKPELIKCLIGLMLNIKEVDEKISLEELEGLFKVYLLKRDIKNSMDETEDQRIELGLLNSEFIKIYESFIYGIVDRGHIMDAIRITKNVLKGIGGEYREILIVKKNIKIQDEDNLYLYTKKHLNDLLDELKKHLKQHEDSIIKEQFNIIGLVEFIRVDLDEKLEESTYTILNQLKEKSLNEFVDERKEVYDECIQEYTNMFKTSYIEELKRRKYEWTVVSEKLKQPYFIDMLYSYLKE